MSVLTAGEGHGLGPMVKGIVQRYTTADVPPPEALYLDRGCCGDQNLCRMFGAWPNLYYRLDIWHFMRRFASVCTTDAHQLYGTFMSRLSMCIFKWSPDDVAALVEAKRSQLQARAVPNPSNADVLGCLTRRELAQHCRRTTRGVEATTALIDSLLTSLSGDSGRDSLGVPLLAEEKVWDLWDSQKRHVACIQDPPGVVLYTEVRKMKKGTKTLPVFRCARGSTSLESFHLHLARFIPGKCFTFSAFSL